MRVSVSSRRHPVWLAALLLTTVSLVLALSGPARAEDYVHRDKTRDVVKVVVAKNPKTKTFETHLRSKPRRKDVDVRKVRVRYDAQSLRITIRTRGDFPSRNYAVIGKVLGAESGLNYEYIDNENGSTFGLNNGKWPVLCDGLESRSGGDKVQLVIPSHCIWNLPWVRVSSQVSIWTSRTAYDGTENGRNVSYYDDAFRNKAKKSMRPKYSPKIRLG